MSYSLDKGLHDRTARSQDRVFARYERTNPDGFSNLPLVGVFLLGPEKLDYRNAASQDPSWSQLTVSTSQ
jgi:hypothetical protein